MARIPPHLMKPNTGPAGPQIPRGAMEAPLRAMGEVLEGAEAIGAAWMKTAERHNEIANKRDALRLEQMMRDGYAEINERLMKEPNPGKWMELYDQGMAQVEARLAKEDVSELVADEARMRFMDFSGRARISVSRDALAENLRQTREATTYGVNKAVAEERFEDARAMVAQADGLFDDGTLGRMNDTIERRQQIHQIEQAMEWDPDGTIEDLEAGKFGWISSTDRKRLVREGQATKARGEREAVERIADLLAGPRPALATRQDLEAALTADPKISEATAAEILRNYDDDTPLDAPTKYGISDGLRTLQEQYEAGEMDETSYRQAYENYGTAIHAMGNRRGATPLREQWRAADPIKLRPAGGAGRGQSGADAIEDELQRLAKRDMANGSFGAVDSEADAKTQRAQDNARAARREAVEQRVRELLRPDMTKDEVRDLWELMMMQGESHGLLNKTKSVRGYVGQVPATVMAAGQQVPAGTPVGAGTTQRTMLPPKNVEKNPAKAFSNMRKTGDPHEAKFSIE